MMAILGIVAVQMLYFATEAKVSNRPKAAVWPVPCDPTMELTMMEIIGTMPPDKHGMVICY